MPGDTEELLGLANVAMRLAALRKLPASQRVKTDSSRFEPNITVTGVIEYYAGAEDNRFFIRSWIDKGTRRVTHQMYVINYYGGEGWQFWQSARGDDARELGFTEISRDVASCSTYGCSHIEQFGIDLPDVLLRQRRASGYAVKIYSKAGSSAVLSLTADQIEVQLRAAAEIAAGLPKPSQ